MAFRFETLRLKTLFKFRSQIRGEPVTNHRLFNPYHAVSVVTPAGASVLRGSVCEASAACGGQRFLAAGAPRLPFPGCSIANCHCRYQHHEDRRDSLRRATDSGLPPSIPWQQSERRAQRGRRVSD